MPIESVAKSAVATPSSPPSQVFAYAGNCAIISAPKNQNHDTPRIDRNTVRLRRVNSRLRQVSVNGFQSIASPGCGGGASGTKRLTA